MAWLWVVSCALHTEPVGFALAPARALPALEELRRVSGRFEFGGAAAPDDPAGVASTSRARAERWASSCGRRRFSPAPELDAAAAAAPVPSLRGFLPQLERPLLLRVTAPPTSSAAGAGASALRRRVAWPPPPPGTIGTEAEESSERFFDLLIARWSRAEHEGRMDGADARARSEIGG